MPRPAAALAATLAGLLGAATAGAHVVPSPSLVESGRAVTVGLAAPNERDEPMTGLAILAPTGVRIVGAEPAGEWRVSETSPSRAALAGGAVAPGAEVTLRVELEAAVPPGPVTLEAEQRYPGGEVVRWDVPLTVVPGGGQGDHDLAAALAAGVLGLTALSGVAVLSWRRRSR